MALRGGAWLTALILATAGVCFNLWQHRPAVTMGG